MWTSLLQEYKEREIEVDFAHGGNVGDNISQEIVTWYKWVRKSLSWTNARDNCKELGGTLFSKINGTTEQLDWFKQVLQTEGEACHWLGIYTQNREEWKTKEGFVLDDSLLKWKKGQPNDNNGNQDYVANCGGYLEDENDADAAPSICDMIHSPNDISDERKKSGKAKKRSSS